MLQRFKILMHERLGSPNPSGSLANVFLPGSAAWSRALGFTLALLFAVMAVTGVALMTVYAPSVASAWGSVFYLQYVLRGGWMVRGIHHWAANATVALMLLHLVHVAVAGAYRRPRELTWWLGLKLLALVLLFEMSGFPLPWDQWGYWASRIEVGIMGSVPFVGPVLQKLFQGGDHYGTLTLTRFYTLHVAVLPAAFVTLLWLHLVLVRRHGFATPVSSVNTPTEATPPSSERTYHPDQTAGSAFIALAVVMVVIVLAKLKGAPLPSPADATSQYPARPVWYFMPLSQLLHMLQGKAEWLGTMVAPGAALGYLVALPLLDRSSDPKRRAIVLAPLFLGLLGAVGLGYAMSRHDAHDAAFQHSVRHAQYLEFRSHALARRGIPPEGPLVMLRDDPEVRPRALFAEHCGTCHAVRGVSTQTKGPALDGFGGRAWARAFLTWPEHPMLMGCTTISDMPPQCHHLGDDGTTAVIEYLFSQGADPHAEPWNAALAQQGSVIYHHHCTTCHQGAGDTSNTDAGDRDGPDLDGWASRAWIRNQILRPGAHENYDVRNHMTKFDDRLPDNELEMILAYMHGLRSTEAPAVMQPPPD